MNHISDINKLFFCLLAMQLMLSTEPSHPEAFLPIIEDLLTSEAYNEAPCKEAWLRQVLIVSINKAKDVAGLTIGQRMNPMWAITRKHRLTASNFGSVLSAIHRNKFECVLLFSHMLTHL